MNIEMVVQERRCKSCGYCFSLCPVSAIEMIYNEGFLFPKIKDNQCIQCGSCLKICPTENKIEDKGLIGIYSDLLLAHATDPKVRHNATSGGVINSLVRFLLQKKIVDGVIMAGYDPDSKIETGAHLITLQNINILTEKGRDFSSRYVLIRLKSAICF